MVTTEPGSAGGHQLTPREAFLAAADAFVAVVGDIPADGWTRPGLGVWDVRALVGHTARATSTVIDYVGSPAERVELDSAVDYLAAIRQVDAALHGAVAVRGVEAGAALGADPVASTTALVAQVRDVLADAPDELVVPTRFGAMRLGDYLDTRTFELVVHTSDIAVAVDLRYVPPPAALSRTVLLASQATVSSGRGLEFLRIITGRDGSAFSIVSG